MASVTSSVGTINTTGGDKAATLTPAVGDLLCVVTVTSGIAGGTTNVTDNNSGGAGTYTKILSDVTSGANTDRLNFWVRTALIVSAVSTIVTATQTSSSGGGLRVLRVAGMTRLGSAAVRSSGVQNSQGTGTTPAPVLSLTPLTTNVIVGAVVNATNPAALTPRSSPAYTEAVDTGWNTPVVGCEIMHINSGDTSATITWGGTSPSAFGSFAVELDASAPAGAIVTSERRTPRRRMLQRT